MTVLYKTDGVSYKTCPLVWTVICAPDAFGADVLQAREIADSGAGAPVGRLRRWARHGTLCASLVTLLSMAKGLECSARGLQQPAGVSVPAGGGRSSRG